MRDNFEDLSIFVGIKDKTNMAGPFVAREDEFLQFSLQMKDSYAKDNELPEYSPLFYSLDEISFIQDEDGLGLG